MDIGSEAAAFVSTFFLLYTLSRFVCGFIIERIGYLRIIIIAGFATLALFIIALSLGRSGLFLLPITGVFISLVYPTILAISVGAFKERAQAMSSALIGIAFILNGVIQFGFGLSNRILGPSWAYRSCVLYTVIMIILLLKLRSILRNRGGETT
jgi:fucose permease